MKVALTSLITALCTYTFYRIIYGLYRRRSYRKLIKTKQNDLENKKILIREKVLKIKNLNLNLTELSLERLLIGIESKEFQALDVLRAFQSKTLDFDDEYNFIIDLVMDCDERLSIIDFSDSLLKGIPVSVKDRYYVENCDCTIGIPSRINSQFQYGESSLIQIVRLNGGVPFVITNMCQTGKSMESSNPIIGATRNPFNKTRTSGGSSGGEGAILACGASILGLGSDIGGSIRIPSHFCGVFGLKPTVDRLSLRPDKSGAEQKLVRVSLGPMARNIDDLIYFFKILIGPELYKADPYVPPLMFNDALFNNKKPLKIGYYNHLGGSQIEPIPAVKRGLTIAKEALIKAGHTLVEFQLPDIDYALFELFVLSLHSDGGQYFVNDLMKDNPVDVNLKLTMLLLKLPKYMRYFIAILIKPFEKSLSRGIINTCGVDSSYNLWKLNYNIIDYKEEVLKKWEDAELDGLICPVLPIAAPLLNTSQWILDVVAYTSIYNLLDYPAGSVPVTVVNEHDIDELIKTYPTNTGTHRRILEDQKTAKGLPIGVQCISMKWREETCLRIMKDLADQLK